MDPKSTKEIVRFNKNSIHIKVMAFTGKEGDFYVTISPTLNVSGYGKTKDESKDSFHENMKLFCSDIRALPKKQIEVELRKLGFKQERLQHKNYSKLYVDENGALQNFEEDTLEENIHEEEMACV
jgi:hypothetical protein